MAPLRLRPNHVTPGAPAPTPALQPGFITLAFLLLLFLVNFVWADMVRGIQAHICSLNWGYKVQLKDKHVAYFNSMGRFENAHTIKVG